MRVGILGTGPGGSVAAMMLAQKGHTVHLFATESAPSRDVGDCLLPGVVAILDELGIPSRTLRELGGMPASGAYFEQVGSGRSCRFAYAEGLPGDPAVGMQVERGTLQRILLDRAVVSGAKLHAGLQAERIEISDSPGSLPQISFRTGTDQALGNLSVDFLIDASGRQARLANQLKLIERGRDSKRAAVFGLVDEMASAAGAQIGDLTISKGAQGWCWSVQVSPHSWSVGLVLPRDLILCCPSPDQAFQRNITYFPEMLSRLHGRNLSAVSILSNLSYQVRQRLGTRWALIGNAAGCSDPVFGSSLLLEIRAGRTLAHALVEGGTPELLEQWRMANEHDLSTYQNLIHLWYDSQLLDNLFFGNPRDPHVNRGITSLLTGNTTSRENLFLAMIKRRTLALRHKTLIMN